MSTVTHERVGDVCPACGESGARGFYAVDRVPVHSVLLMRTFEQARTFPRGDIRLRHCGACDFVFNGAFEASQMRYGEAYEETQAYSPTFDAFQRRLAEDLIRRHDLRHGRIFEIGCGKGEFLDLLCELGGNRGIGFDPSFDAARRKRSNADVTFVPRLYTDDLERIDADLVVCKMTLEHIPSVAGLVRTVRRGLLEERGATVFFQVPNFAKILRDRGFWDIYYEHCSYFTDTSLAGLFRRCGFEPTALWSDYDEQYLMIEARAAAERAGSDPARLPDAELLAFERDCRERVDAWRRGLVAESAQGRRIAVWGGGSKAVAFLAAVDPHGVVDCVVDINPHKQGHFLPGSGRRVVAPEELMQARPDVVVVMNPVYRVEIEQTLRDLGIDAETRSP